MHRKVAEIDVAVRLRPQPDPSGDGFGQHVIEVGFPVQESMQLGARDLQTEIGQLQEAIVSHTVIDHAIGVVITLGGLRPDQGFEVLREVSQHTNIKLRQISEQLVNWVHSEQLPDEIRNALDRALAAARSH